MDITKVGKSGRAAGSAFFFLLTLASLSLPLAGDGQGTLLVAPFSAVWALGAAGLWLGFLAFFRLPRALGDVPLWLLSALFAGIVTLAQSFTATGTAELLTGNLLALFKTLLFFIGRVPLYYMGMSLLKAALSRRESSASLPDDASGREGPGQWLLQRKGLLVLALFILLCWLPYYALIFPGTVSNDSVTQLKEIFGVKPLSAGNPPAQTLLIWMFCQLGSLFQSADLAVALYCVVQGALLSLLFARTAQAALRWGAPKWLFYLTIGFFALCPVFPVFAFCMGKDTNFSMAVLYFSLLAWELVQSPPSDKPTRSFVGKMCLAAALLPLLRNPGSYLALVCLSLLLLRCLGKERRRAGGRQWLAPLCALGVLLGVWAGLALVAIPLSGALPMPEAENYSLPLQQVARVVASQPESLTDQEREAISGVLPLAEIKDAYNGELSDPIKDLWNAQAAPEAKRAFFQTWLTMLPKHPSTYFSAVFHNTYGYLLPGYVSSIKPTLIVGKQAHTTEIDGYFPFSVNAAAQGLREALTRLTHQPLFRLIIAPGLYGWLVLFSLVVLLGSRQRQLLLVVLPAMISLLGCLLSPVNGYFRYAMPLYVCGPLLLALCAQAMKAPASQDEKE